MNEMQRQDEEQEEQQTVYVGNATVLRELLGSAARVSDVDVMLEARGVSRCVQIVCDQLDDESELDVLLAHVRSLRDDVNVVLTTSDALRRHVAQRNEPSDAELDKREPVPARSVRNEPTLEWYYDLLRHALGRDRPARPVVLWGPPGTGKTMALQRVGRMMARDATRRDCLLVSCAEAGDADEEAAMYEQIETFGRTAHPDAVLLVDDYDCVDGQRNQQRLVDALLAAQCRSVVVCNDYFGCRWLRAKSRQLTDVRVRRAHNGKLLDHLRQRFGLPAQLAARIVASADGDVRQAEIQARLCARDKRADGPSEHENELSASAVEHTPIEAPHYSLLRCARIADSAGQADELRLAHWDRTNDSAELLFVNAPRYASGCETFEADAIEVLARMQDYASLADRADQQQRENGFAGADGTQTDKQIYYELALRSPIALLGGELRRQPSRHLREAPKMEFAARSLSKLTSERAATMRAAHTRQTLIGRRGFEQAGQQMALACDAKQADADMGVRRAPGAQFDGTAQCERWSTLLAVVGTPRDLAVALHAIQKKEEMRSASQHALAQRLMLVIDRFAAGGQTADDFAAACQHRADVGNHHKDIPSTAALRRIFGQRKPALVYNEQVVRAAISRRQVKPSAALLRQPAIKRKLGPSTTGTKRTATTPQAGVKRAKKAAITINTFFGKKKAQ